MEKIKTDRSSPKLTSVAEYSARLKVAIERGWLEMHGSGTFVKQPERSCSHDDATPLT